MDLDEIIEKQTGKSPRTLFCEGPEIFMNAEASALASIINQQTETRQTENRQPESSLGREIQARTNGLIIAAGGGLIDNSEAMSLLAGLNTMAESAGTPRRVELFTVFLDVSAETAWRRILAAGELPPFLNTGNPREAHLALHTRRSESYRAFARVTISAENKSPEEIAGEIVKILNA